MSFLNLLLFPRFTLLMTWPPNEPADPVRSLGLNIYMHTEPLPPIAAPPVVVEVRGAPRSNAQAKNSRWVADRVRMPPPLPLP